MDHASKYEFTFSSKSIEEKISFWGVKSIWMHIQNTKK